MKLIHKTPLGKYSANATGVGERRKSTAQRRHLVNNTVSSVGKKKKNLKRKAAHSFSPWYLSIFPFPLSHSKGHQQIATHLSVCCTSVLPSLCHSGTSQACAGPRGPGDGSAASLGVGFTHQGLSLQRDQLKVLVSHAFTTGYCYWLF